MRIIERKATGWPFIPVGLIFITLFLVTACSDGDNGGKGVAAAPVRVAQAREASVPRMLRAVGNARASASVKLVPRVSGEIVAINFKEGQEVQSGQKLIRIDPRPYEIILREKRANLARSEAQLAKASRDRARFGKLVGNGYVSQEAFEQTATEAAALRATVQADRAAVESAALDLAYCDLTAPISGRIGSLTLDKGNMVKSGDSTPIASIDTIAPCYVTFSVPEAYLPAIMEHMEKGPVEVTATPTGGKTERGWLTLVDNNVSAKTGTIPLRGTFANEKRHLWPGQYVEVSLPLGIAENALMVPSRAIQAGRDESYLYAVGPNDTAVYHKVRVLFENDGESAIDSDLRPGDKVVIEGQVRLAPGLPMKILD